MDSKTVLRIDKSDRKSWVIMDTRPLSDHRLSWKAKGLLAYLLGKPDDWTVMIGDVVKRSTDGEYAVRTALQELVDCGYVTRKQERYDDGTFAHVEYIVREQPLGGFPHAGRPLSDNRSVTNDDVTKDEGTSKSSPQRKINPDEELARFGLTGKAWHDANPGNGRGLQPPSGEEPWLTWGGDRIRKRDNVGEVDLRHVGWLLEHVTGVVPKSDGAWYSWRKNWVDWYNEAGGNFTVIEKALRNKWEVDNKKYRTCKAAAVRHEISVVLSDKQEEQKQRQTTQRRIEQSPEWQTGQALMGK